MYVVIFLSIYFSLGKDQLLSSTIMSRKRQKVAPEEDTSTIHEAAEKGDVKRIKALLKQGVPVDELMVEEEDDSDDEVADNSVDLFAPEGDWIPLFVSSLRACTTLKTIKLPADVLDFIDEIGGALTVNSVLDTLEISRDTEGDG